MTVCRNIPPADFLLDTSFTYELGLIAKLLQKVRQQFTLEGHNAELWDETARRFEHVAPVALDLLPADSMLREFYAGEIGGQNRAVTRSFVQMRKNCCQTCTKL